uniref:Uncharacterized protein n=1 Tax=Avena sativa TaxID=4498 RepID=A0ACD5WGB8_AVESA
MERELDVADCSAFVSRIGELRNDVRDPGRESLFDGLYMLRPYTPVPERWLHLRLVYRNSAIVLLVRMDDLYLVGFRQEGQGGNTWEFGVAGITPQLINRSERLGFGGGYYGSALGDLREAPANPEDYSRTPRDFGLGPLQVAVEGLAAYNEGTSDVRRWLQTIIVTIIESIRSQVVCAHIGNLISGEGGWLDSRTILIIKNWEKICTCLIQSANNPDLPGLYNDLRNKGICGNAYEARQVVAILYRGPANAGNLANPRRAKRSVVPDFPVGLTFLEVFKVVIINIDGESPGDLYGTITVDDGLGREVLFFRERSETQSVGPGGLAELTGPKRAIWGYDEVVLDFNLTDADFFPDISPDDEISKGQMTWNAHERPMSQYDTVNEYEMKGEHGSVKIYYAVITNAVVATLVVYLTNGDGESYPDLYGTMTAATSAIPSHEVTIFNTEQKKFHTMRAGDSIPLLRNTVVVPLGSSLKIYADLWDRDQLPDISPDDHIASGVAVFDASLTGTTNKVINGPCGLVTVHVTWSST